jgi:hypothetical protein
MRPLCCVVQAMRAAEMVALAQQKAVIDERPLKRKRRAGPDCYVGPPQHVLMGVRISVFWPDDDAFYKARLPTRSPHTSRHGLLLNFIAIPYP